MASIGSMIRSAKMGKDHIITPRLKTFLSENQNLVLDDWVADIIRDLITKKQRDRSGSFSSSASGQCPRRQSLEYLGAPVSNPPDPQTQQIFYDGTWRHLRWQATLLQAGIIDSVEITLPWEAMRSMGSMDGAGVVPDDHPVERWRGMEFGWELKGVNTFQYKKMLEPPDKFLNQINRYFLSGGFDLFVLIAEDKSSQEWREWVIEPDPERIEAQRQELVMLNELATTRTLPVMKPGCVDHTDPDWKKGFCPYSGNGGTCVSADTWEDVDQWVSA